MKTPRRRAPIIPAPHLHILLTFIATRAMLTIVGVVSRVLLEPFHGWAYLWGYSRQPWLDIWSVWDSGWYLDIAQHGYATTVQSDLPKLVGPGQLNYAFSPLYPMLMRGLGWLVGDDALAGIIISNVFLLVACVFLYKLVRLRDDEDTAERAVRYLLLFPTAFILSGIFSEATFLALAIMCFYFAGKAQWYVVGVLGCLLALTRTLGVLVVLPLLYEYLEARSFKLSRVRPDVLMLGLIPLGLAGFVAYVHHLTGDWLAIVHVQSAWHRGLHNPLAVLAEGLTSPRANVFFITCFVVAVLVPTIAGFRQLRLSH